MVVLGSHFTAKFYDCRKFVAANLWRCCRRSTWTWSRSWRAPSAPGERATVNTRRCPPAAPTATRWQSRHCDAAEEPMLRGHRLTSTVHTATRWQSPLRCRWGADVTGSSADINRTDRHKMAAAVVMPSWHRCHRIIGRRQPHRQPPDGRVAVVMPAVVASMSPDHRPTSIAQTAARWQSRRCDTCRRGVDVAGSSADVNRTRNAAESQSRTEVRLPHELAVSAATVVVATAETGCRGNREPLRRWPFEPLDERFVLSIGRNYAVGCKFSDWPALVSLPVFFHITDVLSFSVSWFKKCLAYCTYLDNLFDLCLLVWILNLLVSKVLFNVLMPKTKMSNIWRMSSFVVSKYFAGWNKKIPIYINQIFITANDRAEIIML